MILSSADIASILGRNEIIRLSAKVSIVDAKPKLSGAEGTYIYISRFPSTEEFEATWTLYIESDDDVDLIIAELKRILPSVKVKPGLIAEVTTTEFRSDNTQTAPEAPKAQTAQVDLTQYEERFQGLVEDIQDRMLLVSSGKPGRDGKDGKDGQDGRDGRDVVATDAKLFDLVDVESGIPLQKGQVLMWNGTEWTNLFVPTVTSFISGGGGGDGEGVIISDTAPTTREDGSPLEEGDQWWDSSTGAMYVYYVDSDSGQWVQSSSGDTGSGSVTVLDDLADVNTAGKSPGDALLWSGGQWNAGGDMVGGNF